MTTRAPEPAGGGDPTQPRTIPPPAASDLVIALRASDWPAVTVEGRVIVGEPAWRAAIEDADPEGRLALWHALGATELEEDAR
jgi:hypothetical protein